MKLHHYMVLGATLIGLVACETRESITGSDIDLVEGTGALALTVDAKEPISTKVGISTSDFPVIISTEEDEIIKEYLVKDLPEKISLEIGKYKVEAHSPFELEKEMDKAYYAGNADLTIINQVTSQVKVTCKRQNCRIRLNYGNDFRSAFKSWTITLNDGSESVLEYTYDGQGFPSNPEDVYWYFEPNVVDKIKVHIDAVTNEGQRISDDRIYAKADAFESYDEDTKYFTGGDALDIYLEVAKVDAPTEGDLSGIIIFDISLWTEDSSESVNIPVEDEVIDDPEMPGGSDMPSTDDKPTLILNGKDKNGKDLSFNEDGVAIVSYSISDETLPTSNVIISTPGKLKSLKATIIAGNEGFASAVEDLGFVNRELVNDDELESLLGAFGMSLPMPENGVVSYTFPIGEFYSLMNIYGPSVDQDQTDFDPDGKDYHAFQILVEDEKGNKASVELRVQISK